MKTVHTLFLAATLTFIAALAMAQDEQKPAPEQKPLPPPATANTPPTSPGTPPPPPDARHSEHHHIEGWHHGSWPMPVKPTPYIGVITVPPPAVLTAQLGLAEGFGLVVTDVLPDSPAAKAGIQRWDVLTKFNDQQLVDPGQFSTLVRALKKDAEAKVTLLRKAQEQTLTVKIDERPLPEHHSYPGSDPSWDYRHLHGDSESAVKMQEYARHMQERAHSYGEAMRQYSQRNASNEVPTPSSPPTTEGAPPIPPEDILREARPGGVAQIRLFQPNATVTYNMANARVVMKDDAGEVEMTIQDGKRSLVARNAQGDTIFEGPIDTAEQRKAVPEDVRKKLEFIEVQRHFAQSPPPPPGEPGPAPDIQ